VSHARPQQPTTSGAATAQQEHRAIICFVLACERRSAVKNLIQTAVRAAGPVALGAVAAAAWAWLLPQRGADLAGVAVVPVTEEVRLAQMRISGRDAVADLLLDGELTLPEAAAWFRQINDSTPEAGRNFRLGWPGASDGEKACRQVISWVHTRALGRHGRSQADAVAAWLQRELDEMLALEEFVEQR
jgi:hypothetical protein